MAEHDECALIQIDEQQMKNPLWNHVVLLERAGVSQLLFVGATHLCANKHHLFQVRHSNRSMRNTSIFRLAITNNGINMMHADNLFCWLRIFLSNELIYKCNDWSDWNFFPSQLQI
jgi:hypothetical protein